MIMRLKLYTLDALTRVHVPVCRHYSRTPLRNGTKDLRTSVSHLPAAPPARSSRWEAWRRWAPPRWPLLASVRDTKHSHRGRMRRKIWKQRDLRIGIKLWKASLQAYVEKWQITKHSSGFIPVQRSRICSRHRRYIYMYIYLFIFLLDRKRRLLRMVSLARCFRDSFAFEISLLPQDIYFLLFLFQNFLKSTSC